MSQEGGSKGNVDWASATLNGIPIPTRFGMVTYSAPREPVGLGKFDFSATLETEPGAFEKFVDSLPKPEPIHLIKRGMKITFDHHQSPRSSILQFLFNGKQATEFAILLNCLPFEILPPSPRITETEHGINVALFVESLFGTKYQRNLIRMLAKMVKQGWVRRHKIAGKTYYSLRKRR